MSVPTTITDTFSSLQQQVKVAMPLVNASNATVTALQLNAASLVNTVQTALTAPSLLDSWTAPTDPALMVTGVLNLSDAADDQTTLSTMRGYAGRAVSNLDQL